MIVLIVDDQYEGKAKNLAKLASSISGVDLIYVASSRDALKVMKNSVVDLLIVDLQIPAELGQDVDIDGGKQLLEYVELHDDIKKPIKVVALTSHMDSYEHCQGFFAARGWALLHDPSLEDLEVLLTAQLMGHIQTASYDIALITALEHTELEAVLALPYEWKAVRFLNDITSYYSGVVTISDGSTKTIIACSSPRMGMAAAAVLATKVCIKFKPKILVMTGVAAAIEGEARLGDILVADPSWDWGSGKLTMREGKPLFLSDPAQIPLDPNIAAKVRTLAVSREYLDEIYVGFKGKRPSHDLSVKVGPVASGAVVLEDPSTVELIRSQNRKTLGIEMEAYGIMSAAFYMGAERPVTIVIKSVCDFADPNKNNDWQPYAAYTSARYLDRLLVGHIFD
nr:hypothetical protein [Pseudomonas sp. P818]